ncbi:MAG: hypothetical protein ACREHV_10475 [Rhizomicrobium sp.]
MRIDPRLHRFADEILLRTSANSGHGIGSSLSERIAEQTDMLAFLFAQLGMTNQVAVH